MSYRYRLMLPLLATVLGACTTPSGTATDDTASTGMQPVAVESTTAQQPRSRTATAPAATSEAETVAVTFGRGIAKANGLDVTFMFNVTVYADETVEGTFTHSASGPAGSIDLEGEVTCANLDSASGRGRLGGRITRNGSTDPRYAAQPGSDIGFRLLDRNREHMQPLIGLPQIRGSRLRSARAFCNSDSWKDEGLYLVDPGALAIFP